MIKTISVVSSKAVHNLRSLKMKIMHLVPLKQRVFYPNKCFSIQVPTGEEIMKLFSRNIKSPVHIQPLSLDPEHKMRKKKNDHWITMSTIFPPISTVDRPTKGFGATGSLAYHHMPHSHNAPSRLQWFLGKKNHSRISRLPHPSPKIICVPYSVYTVASPLSLNLLWLCCLLSSTALLFCSPSGSCLGPLGPSSYQLVMGPGGSGPRPWTQTDWLASYLHSGLCVPFPPLHAALLSELGQTEKNAAREQIWTQHTHTHTH